MASPSGGRRWLFLASALSLVVVPSARAFGDGVLRRSTVRTALSPPYLSPVTMGTLSQRHLGRKDTALGASKRPPQKNGSTKGKDRGSSSEMSASESSSRSAFAKMFSRASSSVRSTSQTEAIGQKRERRGKGGAGDAQTDGVDADDDISAIPGEVLRPFGFLLLSQFILFIGVGAVIPSIPLYGQSIGLSSTSNGIVISAPAVALLLASRSAGTFADVARKPAMMGGMAVIALSDLGTAFSTTLPALVLARLGLGLGRGFAEAGERGMLADLANRAPSLRGRALALQQACIGLGIAVGAPAGGYVVETYGIRASFLCVTVAAGVALGMYAFLPETVVGESETPVDKAMRGGGDANDDDEGDAADWLRLLQTSPSWRGLALSQSGLSFGFACKIAVVPVVAASLLPGGAVGAGALLSGAGLAALAGAPLGGFLADRVGAKTAAGFSGIGSGLFLASVPLCQSFSTEAAADDSLLSNFAGMSPEAAAFSSLILLWSLLASAQGPALTAYGQEMAPQGAEATALGLPRAAGDGTYIIAPLALGIVSDAVAKASASAGVGADAALSTASAAVAGGLGACTAAGGAVCLGSLALLFSSSTPPSSTE